MRSCLNMKTIVWAASSIMTPMFFCVCIGTLIYICNAESIMRVATVQHRYWSVVFLLFLAVRSKYHLPPTAVPKCCGTHHCEICNMCTAVRLILHVNKMHRFFFNWKHYNNFQFLEKKPRNFLLLSGKLLIAYFKKLHNS